MEAQLEQQQFLIVEDVYEAMRMAARAIAAFHEPTKAKAWAKVVGHMLWPSKDPDDCGRYLANCLDKDRPEKLDPEQYLWLKLEAKRAGCHILHAFDCDQTEYQRSNPVEPKDEIADLQTQYINSVRLQQQIAERMEKHFERMSPLKVVKP